MDRATAVAGRTAAAVGWEREPIDECLDTVLYAGLTAPPPPQVVAGSGGGGRCSALARGAASLSLSLAFNDLNSDVDITGNSKSGSIWNPPVDLHGFLSPWFAADFKRKLSLA